MAEGAEAYEGDGAMIESTEANKIVLAAIDWFRAGEQLGAERPRTLPTNRAYTEAQLRLRAAVQEYLHA